MLFSGGFTVGGEGGADDPAPRAEAHRRGVLGASGEVVNEVGEGGEADDEATKSDEDVRSRFSKEGFCSHTSLAQSLEVAEVIGEEGNEAHDEGDGAEEGDGGVDEH